MTKGKPPQARQSVQRQKKQRAFVGLLFLPTILPQCPQKGKLQFWGVSIWARERSRKRRPTLRLTSQVALIGSIMEDKIIAENLPPQLRESGLFCCRGRIGGNANPKIPYDPKTGRGLNLPTPAPSPTSTPRSRPYPSTGVWAWAFSGNWEPWTSTIA